MIASDLGVDQGGVNADDVALAAADPSTLLGSRFLTAVARLQAAESRSKVCTLRPAANYYFAYFSHLCACVCVCVRVCVLSL